MTQGSCEAPSVLAAPVIGQVASVAGASSGAWIKLRVGVGEGGTKLKILRKKGQQGTERPVQWE